MSPDSALAAAIQGYTPWSIEAQLTAMLVDATNVANWQRAGKKNAPKPQPIPRPWLEAKGTRVGKDPIPVADFDDWWDSQSRARAEDP